MKIQSAFLFSLLSGIAALTLAPGIAAGQTTSTTVITSCVSKLSGVSRIVASPTSCNVAVENVVQWNQQGQLGPKGDQGSQGPKGDQGAQGRPGTTGATGSFSTNGFVTAVSFNADPYLNTFFYFDPSIQPTLNQNAMTNTVGAGNFFVVPSACTLSSLKVAGVATSDNVGSLYIGTDFFELFVNEADAGMGCTINEQFGGGPNVSCSNTTQTVALAQNDRLSLSFHPELNANSMRFSVTLACQ